MTTPPTPAELQAMRERWQRTTQGEWLYRPRKRLDDWGDIRAGKDGFIVALARDAGATDEKQKDEHRKRKTDPYEDNGQFIAHAHQDVPALLAACEAQQQEIERLNSALDTAGRTYLDKNAECLRLRKALEPFAKAAEELLAIPNTWADNITFPVELGWLKRALSAKGDGNG